MGARACCEPCPASLLAHHATTRCSLGRSLAGGLLSDRYAEEPKKGLFGQTRYSNVDLNTSSLKMYYNIVKQAGGQEVWRDLLLTLKQVADKHKVSVANVALRWVMQQGSGRMINPIVGIRNSSHIADNARVGRCALAHLIPLLGVV